MLEHNRLIGFDGRRLVAGEQNAFWNSADKNASITLSGGDTIATDSGTPFQSLRGILGRSTGKFYFEALVGTSAGNLWVGLGSSGASLSSYTGATADSAGQASGGNAVTTWTKAQAGTTTVAVADVLQYAVDFSAGYIFFGKNNLWLYSSDPTTGTNPWVTGISGTLYPMGSPGSGTITLKTKTSELTYSPPSGYSQWAAA